jgi:Rrf2 family protein
MQISTKGRYALRFLLDLAQHRGEGSISLKSVAERQGISKKYLEHVVSMLSPTGMLRITRGYQGGYELARDPASITVAEVLRITEGGLAPVSCLAGDVKGCERRDYCLTLPVWEGLEKVISDYLEGISLQDILTTYGPQIEYYI